MSRYIPNTDSQQTEMLKEIGLESIEDLFTGIPEAVRMQGRLNLPDALSEPELVSHMKQLAAKNKSMAEYTSFLGAGIYDHYIPSIINHMLLRQEFYTAYTPYQPEISQGTLQAIFEYQTMVCELTGMDVANASMYDGASALAEAALMACQTVQRGEVAVARSVHPEYRSVLDTYTKFIGIKVIEVGYVNGRIDMADLESKVSSNTAAVILQSPNFFGVIENLGDVGAVAHRNKALFIAAVDPISLGILKSPGESGADIVVGEGQSLGNSPSFGGPCLGFFAATKELLRRMPGRIAGQTTDKSGNRGFVLTMQTREQHIRREKATSNICSNQALNALAATIYLSTLGRRGLKELAELCLQKSHYAYDRLIETGSFEPCFNAPFFKEFAVKSKVQVAELNKKLLDKNIMGGYDLSIAYPELEGGWLVAVTEKRSKADMDKLKNVIEEQNAEAFCSGGVKRRL